MRRTLLICFGLAVSMTAIGGAQAQPATEFHCLTTAGRHKSSTLGTVTANSSIAGQISISRMSMHVKYATFGGAVFVAADNSWMARLEVSGSSRFRRNLLEARLRIERGKKVQLISLGDLGLDTPVPFQLTLADGKVTAVFGKKTAEAALPISPSRAKLACSTGDVHFTGVRFTN